MAEQLVRQMGIIRGEFGSGYALIQKISLCFRKDSTAKNNIVRAEKSIKFMPAAPGGQAKKGFQFSVFVL
ncbi:hypothetical protein [Desulfuromonas versatilis]|uniref:hypothetical protein n=1 Tax=Desulfuromonas versatilis TaxID=2802975 RepID=UPI001C854051|nr:hypothetical protein [Desulfuromonas versatilis]